MKSRFLAVLALFLSLIFAQPAFSDFYFTSGSGGGGGSGVSQIIAGSGISVSPVGGTGAVTVTSISGGGSVTSVGVSSSFPGLSGSVANPNTTPMITLASATGLTSHQFLGTFTGTVITLNSIAAADLPGAANALSQFNTNGIMVQTAANTFTSRNIVSTSGTLTITNGNGTAGNMSVDMPNTTVTPGSYTTANITVDAQGRLTAASSGSGGGAVSSVSNNDGTLTISPTTGAVVASLANNVAIPGNPTTTTQVAGTNNTTVATTAYSDALAAGKVKVGNVSGVGTAVTLSGDISTTSNAGVITLAQPLHALVGYNTTGFLVQTALNTFAGRSFTSTGTTITVTNPAGTAGNVNLDLPNSGATAGSYTNSNITVNAQGIVTSAANGSASGGVSSVTNADGSITASPTTGAVVLSVASNGVTNAKLRQSAALSVIGNATNATANVSDISATSNNQIFASTAAGTGIGFRAMTAADEPATTVNSAGNLSPLFSTSVATQALNFSLSTCNAHSFLGNNTGSSAAFAVVQITNADLPTSGATAGSYTNANITINAQGIVTAASNGSGGGSGTVSSGTGNQQAFYASSGTTVSGDANVTSVNGALTLGQSGTAGSVVLNGATSGTATVNVPAVAGSTTFTLPGTNGTSGQLLSTNGSGVTSWVNTPARFISADTSLGTPPTLVTLPHGLSATPKKMWYSLINQTTELGYVTNDEAFPQSSGTTAAGVAFYSDGTNVNCTISSALTLVGKTSGAVGAITASKWKIRLYAEP